MAEGKLLEFPPVMVERDGFRPVEKTTEQIVAELAPLIQTEADLQHVLAQSAPEARTEIEKCLRAHGACKEPEHPAC